MTESETQNLTRPSLLVRIRDAGDVESWRTFVTIYAPLILGYCRSRGLQGADADDVAQEVFSKVMRTIRGFSYQPERGRFRDWLGTVTHSELCRSMNRLNRVGRGVGGTESTTAEPVAENPGTDWCDHFHAHVLNTALNEIRSQFEARTWNAFELVWLKEKPAADAAHELGMPLDAIYVAKSRVLKRLKEKVLEFAEDIPTSMAAR